jgi:hypothetical protein
MSINLDFYKDKIKKLANVSEVRVQVAPMEGDTYSEKWYEANDYYLRKTSYEGGARIRLITTGSRVGIDRVIAGFNLMQMPACCGICVLTGSYVNYDFRSRGIATLLGQLQRDIATWNGFTVLLCTDVATNTPQKKVLSRNGWFDIWRFQNKRTDNHVDISVTDLDPDRPGQSLHGEPSHPVETLYISDVTFGSWVSWLLSSLISMD